MWLCDSCFNKQATKGGGILLAIGAAWKPIIKHNMKLDFVLLTVQRLLNDHGKELQTGVLLHSDQGVHYTSIAYEELLKNADLRQSMSRRGNCWDNAPQESFFGHMKDEIDISHCSCFDDIEKIIMDWIDYYNNERYQWDLAKLAPSEYYKVLPLSRTILI